MNFGLPGVIGVGLIVGILFGTIYEWQRCNRANPFALLVAVLTTLAFIIVIYKKLPVRIADMPLEILVPVGFLCEARSLLLRELPVRILPKTARCAVTCPGRPRYPAAWDHRV